METQLPLKEIKEQRDYIARTFTQYSHFKVETVFDDEVKDYHGEQFLPVKFKVIYDNEHDSPIEVDVLMDDKFNLYVNPYEDHLDKVEYPSDIFRDFFFEAAGRIK